MSIPTLQFSTLSLPDDNPGQSESEEMRFDITLEERKIIVRDIISSFHENTLPSEFRPEEYKRITEDQGRRPRTELTIPDDFEATCMQWACHDAATWKVLNDMQSSGNRALKFEQKVKRRLAEQFDKYDELPGKGTHQTAREVNAEVLAICRRIMAIVKEVGIDIDTRTGGQYNAARILLTTLGKVCERNDEIPFTRRSGRLSMDSASSSTDTAPTLYRGLIGSTATHFILDSLETVQEKWPNSLATREAQNTMRGINELLVENGASQEYLTQFQGLISE